MVQALRIVPAPPRRRIAVCRFVQSWRNRHRRHVITIFTAATATRTATNPMNDNNNHQDRHNNDQRAKYSGFTATAGSNRHGLQICPVDCAASTWTSWRECSASCGGQGTTSRAREIVVAAQVGGQACPSTLETAAGYCVTAMCPVDCSVSAWSSWSSCSVSCGAGAAVRTRSVIQQPMNGGQLCGLTSESSPCTAQFCPIDCAATAWTSWQTCSSLCSGMTSSHPNDSNLLCTACAC